MPAMLAIMQWGDKWQQDTPFVVVRDRKTGLPIAPISIRNQDDETITMDDLFITVAGPHGEETVEDWPLDWSRADADIKQVS
jgi:hypothetical protein